MQTSLIKTGTYVERVEGFSDSFFDLIDLEAADSAFFFISSFRGLMYSLLGNNKEFSLDALSFQEPPPVSGFISCNELLETVYVTFKSDSYL